MNRVSAVLLVAILAIIGGLGWMVNHYRDNAINYKDERDKAAGKLKLANETITDITTRQRDVASLDAKYTKELSDAKAKLDALQQCVSSGKCGLRLNAKCPTVNTTGTASVDDAASPRLTDAAQRDYFILRERIETTGKQIAALQQYIKEQCLR